jgi:2-keto-4-pentenoate hydratase/2-oxohepta-3-ene-1,7-dioic acid hydratase in catechol pathway
MKIICIARNYKAHIEEFDRGRSVEVGRPQFFMKPDTALLRNNEPFYIPDFSSEVDYECELVVRINRVGRAIAPKFAHRYYSEVGLGIDFTARDLQREAITAGLPWEAAKAFDRSAALSPEFLTLADLGRQRVRACFDFAPLVLSDSEPVLFTPSSLAVGHPTPPSAGAKIPRPESKIPSVAKSKQALMRDVAADVQDLRFEMMLGGEVRQTGWTREMIFTVDEIIAHVSRFVTLKMGDLIYTGTPAGVGAVKSGDRITASLEGHTLLDFAIK